MTQRRRRSSATGLGRWGEQHATELLIENGMTIVERNWRCSLGEIDIIAADGADLVVVEVKTRRDDVKGSPLEAVTPEKITRLRRLAAQWLAAASEQPNPPRYRAIRVDVIAITRPLSGAATVLHVRGVQ